MAGDAWLKGTFWLEGGVVGAGDKTRAGLDDVGEFAVTDDTGIGIFLAKVLQQFIHRLLLGLSAGVGRMAFGIETALVADADRTAVVFPGMCPSDILGQD